MSRKNEFAAFQATGPRTRSHSHKQDSEDSRKVRDGQPRNEMSRHKPSAPLSADDVNEQIRAFFAKDLV
jgi:hypothetical protein